MKKIIKTEAWVLEASKISVDNNLKKKTIMISPIEDDEVLCLPIYGSFEGNILHAIQRFPTDICIERNEDEIVLGNSGVIQVEQVGSGIKDLNNGDFCLLFCNSMPDEYGYPNKITVYDAPHTIGLFSKKTKFKRNQLVKIPSNFFSLKQWAAFSLRYITAWSNWKVAYSCWQSQILDTSKKEKFVFSWGGGVGFAELTLARKYGCKVFMLTSSKERIQFLENNNIYSIDRTKFSDEKLIEYIFDLTNDNGATIFIDNIGRETSKITFKATGRQGVITTCGWKTGTMIPVLRPLECIKRHIHVHTHYAAIGEGEEAVEFAIRNNWIPPFDNSLIYTWNNIPQMVEDYKNGKITSYFPIYSINKI